MKNFPSFTHLSQADLQDVLLLWHGLGYYSSANRIHQSSKILIKCLGFNIDQDPHSWPFGIDQCISPPGIGISTAGIIISSAFDFPTPLLDGKL